MSGPCRSRHRAVALFAGLCGLLACAGAMGQDEFSFDIDVTHRPASGPDVFASDEAVLVPGATPPAARALPGLPAEADLVALHRDPAAGLTWFALDVSATLPSASGTLLARPRDLLSYDETLGAYAIAIAAEDFSVPDGIGIDAIARDPIDGAWLLSFDGWFEADGALLQPGGLYRYRTQSGAFDFNPAFDPVLASIDAAVNLDVADLPTAGMFAGELLVGFDTAFTAGAFALADNEVASAEVGSSRLTGALDHGIGVADSGSGHDLDALWTAGPAVVVDPIFSDGFEN